MRKSTSLQQDIGEKKMAKKKQLKLKNGQVVKRLEITYNGDRVAVSGPAIQAAFNDHKKNKELTELQQAILRTFGTIK